MSTLLVKAKRVWCGSVEKPLSCKNHDDPARVFETVEQSRAHSSFQRSEEAVSASAMAKSARAKAQKDAMSRVYFVDGGFRRLLPMRWRLFWDCS